MKNTLKTNNKATDYCRKSLTPAVQLPLSKTFGIFAPQNKVRYYGYVDTSSWAVEAEDEASIIASHSRSMSSLFALVIYAGRKI